MSESSSSNPVIQDPAHDLDHHDEAAPVHSHEEEVAHARQHFRENNIFFVCYFLPVILITVVLFYVNFGVWNHVVTWTMAAVRSALIAYFLATLFKQFSFVFRTLFFCFIFLLGMIFLSLWDSELVNHEGHGIGNPIWNFKDPASMHP